MPNQFRHPIPARYFAWLAVAVISMAGVLQARTFTSSDGRSIEGEVVKVQGESAVIKLTTGRSVTVPFNLLVEADQTYLAEWAKKEALNRIPRVEVKIDSNKRDTNVQAGYDERRGSFKFEIDITNEERDFEIKGATATLVVLGDYLYEKDTLVVMQRTEFKDINIAFAKTQHLAADQVRYEYDKDDYTHGIKYEGYVFVLRNSTGKVIDVSGTNTRIEKLIEPILKLKKGDYCNERYEKINRSSSGINILR